jgi:hypothetical protein
VRIFEPAALAGGWQYDGELRHGRMFQVVMVQEREPARVTMPPCWSSRFSVRVITHNLARTLKRELQHGWSQVQL